MPRAALTSPDYDEAPVSSYEVLESNIVAIRADLNELKTDFRAAVARIDNAIAMAVSRLESEIRAVAAKADSDLKQFAARIESQLSEMRGEDRSQREKIDRNYETLSAKIDATNEKLGNLDRKVTGIESKLTVLLWVVGGLGSLITLVITAGKALHWF